MQIDAIKTREPFENLFKIYEEDYEQIIQDIKQNGYDEYEPVLLWEEEGVLIDGHTRLTACKELEIPEIPTKLISFGCEEDAIKYSIKRNANKGRKVTPGDKLRLIRILDKPKPRGEHLKNYPRDSQGHVTNPINLNLNLLANDDPESKDTAKETARLVGIGYVNVIKIRTILNYGTKEDIEDLENDKISVDAAWKKAKAEKEKIEAEMKAEASFNQTNENIDWAKWSWNPITGCKHGCKYCYARDIANRFFPHKFEPHFYPKRLNAPSHTKIPKGREDEPGINNVFVCSMADILGEWVDKEWISKIIHAMEINPHWNYILLTKNPKRYLEFDWPKNCWLGATADTQKRMNNALSVFKDLEHPIRFTSCEPLMEQIKLPENPPVDWIIIGGRSKTSGMPEGQPDWKWVKSLLIQCDAYEIPIYMKPNLTVRAKEYPKEITKE